MQSPWTFIWKPEIILLLLLNLYKSAAWDQQHRYSMDFYMEEASRVLDTHNKSSPLFLYFAHQEQHVPLEGPPEPVYSSNCANVKKTDIAHKGRERHTLCTMMNRLDAAVCNFIYTTLQHTTTTTTTHNFSRAVLLGDMISGIV